MIKTTIINSTPIIPASNVLSNASLPKDASTVFEDISVNLVCKLPEFIKLTKSSTSCCLKLPCIITSDAKA